MKALRRSQTSSSSSTSSSSNTPSPSTSSSSSSSSSSSWVHLRSALFVVTSSSPASCSSISSDRARLKSPWSRRKRKCTLSPQQWKSLFTSEGRLRGGGVKFLKKVRSGGVDPSIRAEVWPFLLGVYDLNSTREEREVIRTRQRKVYEKLRRQCRRQLKRSSYSFNMSYLSGENNEDDDRSCVQDLDSSSSDDVVSARESLSSEERSPEVEDSDDPSTALLEGDNDSRQIAINDDSALNSESSDSESSEEPDAIQVSSISEGRGENDNGREENDNDVPTKESVSPARTELHSELCSSENFATWQRIIRVDAVRDNPEWASFSQSQTVVSESRARRSAQTVGLKDFDHLEPSRIYHAARLVAILEAYALYDPEIGYCQGMSDLLSPIITVITEDHEAFWCFVGFMKKARHNFRLDEVGIRRQLGIVSKIIKYKDSHFFRHLEKLQAEDCFFVYRMVVVLFRRELTFEQTICLWEVMWADQAAIRAGIGKSAWSRIRQRAPPTDDLLLYAIAASVLQKRKLIIEKYSSMDEILRECNGMSGQLDVWKLLDDAHDLVMNLHDKIETSFQ